jgi:hypothetical protein
VSRRECHRFLVQPRQRSTRSALKGRSGHDRAPSSGAPIARWTDGPRALPTAGSVTLETLAASRCCASGERNGSTSRFANRRRPVSQAAQRVVASGWTATARDDMAETWRSLVTETGQSRSYWSPTASPALRPPNRQPSVSGFDARLDNRSAHDHPAKPRTVSSSTNHAARQTGQLHATLHRTPARQPPTGPDEPHHPRESPAPTSRNPHRSIRHHAAHLDSHATSATDHQPDSTSKTPSIRHHRATIVDRPRPYASPIGQPKCPSSRLDVARPLPSPTTN